MHKKIALALILSASLIQAATRVWAPLPEIINIHSDFQYATARVLKSYIDAEGTYEVYGPAKPAEGESIALPSTEQIKADALANKCTLYMVTSMTRLGDNIMVNVELRTTDTGELIWSDRLKASNPDDIDPIAMRVGKALGTNEKAAGKDDIYSVTSYDERSLKKKKSNNSFGIAIGGTLVPNHPFNNDPFIGGVGAVWSYDTRDLIVDVEGDLFLANDRLDLMSLGVNIWRPLSEASISPYFGGGLAIGTVMYEPEASMSDPYPDTDSKSGLLISAGGGVLLSRTSTISLRIEMRGIVAAFKVADAVPVGIQTRLIATF